MAEFGQRISKTKAPNDQMVPVLFNNKQACDQNYLIPDTAKDILLGMDRGMVRANAN